MAEICPKKPAAFCPKALAVHTFAMRMARILLNIRYMSYYKDDKKRPLVERIIIFLVARLLSRATVHTICNKIMTWYRHEDFDYVACLAGIYGKKEGFPKWVIGEGILLKFEDGYFIAPEKYDIYLRQLYGNYMKVPSGDKRQHHKVIFASMTSEFSPKL